jgi:predicted metal-dependent phosphoesterase TrpH
MMPAAMVSQAKSVGLDIIAVCDHNSAENAGAVVRAGMREGLYVIPGMEVTSREEVHVLGLFRSEARLLELQELVYDNLPGENDEEAFGPQITVDEFDRITGSSSRLLIGATTLALEELVETIHKLKGLAIASHVDRQGFSIIGQLGFIPKTLELDGLEVSRTEAAEEWKDYAVVTSSDAHYLNDIGKNVTSFTLETPTFDEIEMALLERDGRKVTIN